MELKNTAPRHVHLLERVNATTEGEKLPLLHITATGIARSILLTGRMEARPCKFFKQKLLYFFFGRPAYRMRGEDEKSDQITRSPFVFLLDADHVIPKYVFPFDSGAALAGKYSGEDPTLALSDYELEASIEGARKHLNWAFDGIDDYLSGRLKQDILEDVEDYESSTRGYVTIAQQATKTINSPDLYDDRAAAIEISSEKNVDLKAAVNLAIVPKQYLEGSSGKENTEILDALKLNEIDTMEYDWQAYRDPTDIREEINILVRKHYKNLGLIE